MLLLRAAIARRKPESGGSACGKGQSDMKYVAWGFAYIIN